MLGWRAPILQGMSREHGLGNHADDAEAVFLSHPHLHLGLSTAAWTLTVHRRIPWLHASSILLWTATAYLLIWTAATY
jgi:hypothetical protein